MAVLQAALLCRSSYGDTATGLCISTSTYSANRKGLWAVWIRNHTVLHVCGSSHGFAVARCVHTALREKTDVLPTGGVAVAIAVGGSSWCIVGSVHGMHSVQYLDNA